MDIIPPEYEAYWKQLDSGFPRVRPVFVECVQAAQAVLDNAGVSEYLDSARFLGKMGRGAEPILIFLETWPDVARLLGATALPPVMVAVKRMWKSPNSPAIVPFLQSLPATARRLHSLETLQAYLDLVLDFMDRTTGSIHGHHATFPSPGLPVFFKQVPVLLHQLALSGLKNWVDYGIRNYDNHPERQTEYFNLQSADSRAVLQRERHGTLLVDNDRQLGMYLRSLWEDEAMLIPYDSNPSDEHHATPYYDQLGIRLPDVYDDFATAENAPSINGINRYRAALAHIAAHRRWTRPVIADNLSPGQRMAVECLEDCRVDYLAMQLYPGLRRLFLSLHPAPAEDAVDDTQESGVRHRLAMLSRAIFDPQHGYQNPHLIDFAQRFHTLMREGEQSTQAMVDLAVVFVARTRRQSDNLPKVHFQNTVVSYRDDNRQMWMFIEEGDEEEAFDAERKVDDGEVLQGLPPRHYPEWDYHSQSFRPDWVSVYETLHPTGQASQIDKLLDKHAALAKRLKKMLDLLKPQDKVRIRYQEEGSELDLDVALRSLIDYKSGSSPDPRINMSHRNDGRNIAVLLLLDLSESLNQVIGEQSILQLSQEAVSLLGWAVDKLGDPFAIAGFHSNTRHDVRYYHIKGFSEEWDDTVKGRLAAMEASYSTRMGAAMRHAAHYLGNQQADKKLLLILTDGEPADIDSRDGRMLIEDARQAVNELDQQGIYSYCINLDPKADEYVTDIFGKQYAIIDKVESLPIKLPELFIALTK